MNLPEHFSLRELSCRCGCGTFIPDADALRRLEALRRYFGHPLHLNSATRCQAHNTAVGGAPQSYHMRGRAFDIRLPANHRLRHDLLRCIQMAGFRGLILYENFVHVDNRQAPYVSRG